MEARISCTQLVPFRIKLTFQEHSNFNEVLSQKYILYLLGHFPSLLLFSIVSVC